jgi:hypothetical protein
VIWSSPATEKTRHPFNPLLRHIHAIVAEWEISGRANVQEISGIVRGTRHGKNIAESIRVTAVRSARRSLQDVGLADPAGHPGDQNITALHRNASDLVRRGAGKDYGDMSGHCADTSTTRTGTVDHAVVVESAQLAKCMAEGKGRAVHPGIPAFELTWRRAGAVSPIRPDPRHGVAERDDRIDVGPRKGPEIKVKDLDRIRRRPSNHGTEEYTGQPNQNRFRRHSHPSYPRRMF